MGMRYDRTTPLIPALHQPAMLLDLAAEASVPVQDLLAGTGLAPGAFDGLPSLLSPAQWLRMLANAERALGAPDTAFVLGRRMLPGHFGAASHALQQAGCVREALQALVAHPARLSPLLMPRMLVEADAVVLLWTEAVGLAAQRRFVVDMTMTAVASMLAWCRGERLPWTFCFNRVPPRRPEQHEAYLGGALRFGCHVDAMLLPPALLDEPWPRAAAPGAEAARQAAWRAAAQEAPASCSLLAALQDHLLEHLHEAPSLEAAAAAMSMSPSTLKRRLAAEGSHFQAELDRMRSLVALHCFRFRGWDNTAVARQLGFHDVPNFRRSFKRWTGLTPQALRPLLAG